MTQNNAFSLIEVVISVAIFAGAILAVLGLLGPSLLSSREAVDAAVAARIADSVNMELKRLERDSTLGFSWITTQTSHAGEIELFGLQDGTHVVISGANGADRNPITGTPRGIVVDERYFRIVIRELSAPASSNRFLALSIRAEWPYSGMGGSIVPVEERNSFIFSLGLRP